MGGSIDDVIKSLEDDSGNFFKWFLDNQLKANSDKCYLITSKQSYVDLKIRNINIENSTCENLLGVKVENKLNFNEHLDEIIKKVSRQVSDLSRIFPFMELKKRRFLMISFFTSQFSYCLLIWMCHSRTVNRKINKLLVFQRTFKETDKSVLIHFKNLQVLATEMLKIYRNVTPLIVRQLFQSRKND